MLPRPGNIAARAGTGAAAGVGVPGMCENGVAYGSSIECLRGGVDGVLVAIAGDAGVLAACVALTT